MKYTLSIIIMVAVIVAVVWLALTFSHISPFEKARTPAEKALDSILKKVGDDDYFLENAHIRAGAVMAKFRVDYSPMFTDALAKRMAAQEKQLVDEQCGGRYIDGELCGLDYNPVLCAQDVNDQYYYRTLQADETHASIDYSWPYKRDAVVAHYQLIKDADGWKIDSIRCALK